MSIEQGLSQSSVICVLQDSRGFIWIGTEAGLNRYDGFNFAVFKPEELAPNSLSNNYIYSLLEDRQGNIWVGTDEGLNRFDRFRETFTQYLNKPSDEASISGNKIWSLYEDRAGNIWVGTEAGLNLYLRDKEGFRHFQANPDNPRALSHNDVRHVREDKNGNLWLATFGGGVNVFNPKSMDFTQYRHDPKDSNTLCDDQTLAVQPDKEGYVWIGTATGGLCRFHPASGQFKTYRNDPANPSSLSHDQVNCILQDDEGILWLGTNEGGLNQFDPKTEKFFAYRNNPRDRRSICADRILSIYHDRSGMFWIGSYGNGLSKFRKEESNFIHYNSNPEDPTSLSHNYVRSFCVDGLGRLWVGTDSQGLNCFHRDTQTFTHFKNSPRDPSSLSNDRVFSIVEDQLGQLWVGTYNGLNRMAAESGKFVRYLNDPSNPRSLSDNRIRSMSLSKSGYIWIGTDGGGLNRLDPKSGQFTRYRYYRDNPNSLSYDRIFGVYADPVDDIIWVATFGGGLNKFDPVTERFVRYQHEPGNAQSLSNNYLMPIIRSQDGFIYAGSNGGGLSKLDPRTGRFRNYTEDDGMPNNTVYGILEDGEGNLWMSTNRGVARFNPRTEKIKAYDVNDGLQSNEFNGGSYYKSRDGIMYFGGINGYNEFDPKTLRDNPNVPPIVVTDFQLLNRSVPIGKMADGRTLLSRSIIETTDLSLSYRDSTIAFDFAALSFVAPEKNLYAYRMEGFDQDWNYSGKRHFATYTNLPPKSYVFHVKGSNNDGVWNEEGVSIRIRIAPPFWKTLWFIGLSILFIGMAAYGWYTQRIRKLERAKAELERLVALRTQELKEISLKDPLTGLRNRRFISEVLAQDIHAFIKKKCFLLEHKKDRRKKEDSYVYGVLMIDIDHFKTINDRYGHDIGDKWLVSFAQVMRQFTRADDELIRYGGEEFLVVLKNTVPENMEAIALKLKEELSKLESQLQNPELKRTCSIGYTQFPFYGTDPSRLSFDHVVKIADLGLYYAKHNGRDLVVKVTPAEERLPEPGEVQEMTTSLEFGIEKGFFSIEHSR